MDLNARELIEPIRKLFDQDYVDITICGDLEDVEIELGLRSKRSTPKPRYGEIQFDKINLSKKHSQEEPLDDLLFEIPLIVEQTLKDHGNNNSIQSLVELDGYFASIACSPTLILPSVWQPALWGGETTMPTWESIEQAQSFTNALMAIYNTVMDDVINGHFMPEYYETDDVDGSSSLHLWCKGFMHACELWKDSSQLPQVSLNELMLTLKRWSNSSYSQKFKTESEEFEDQMIEVEKDFIALLNEFRPELSKTNNQFSDQYVDHFPTSQQYVREHPKIGRNDPCFCGSGKKFKRCCLH